MADRVLTLEYRPVRFAEVVGQEQVKPILRQMVRSGSVPPALIFAGTRGTGKTTMARILAAALNCDDEEQGDACGSCPQCKAVQTGGSMSVLEIDAASNGGVDEVRRLREICSYSHQGEWRVVILDEAHNMSREAFNALLKILEEPPPGTVFALLTTEEEKILGTVRSRAMSFVFRRLSTEQVLGRLREISGKEEIPAEESLFLEIVTRAEGGMRDAVMLLDQASRVGVKDGAGFRELHGILSVAPDLFEHALRGELAPGFQIIEDAWRKTGDAEAVVDDLTLLVRDLIVLRAGAELLPMSESDREVRGRLVSFVGLDILTRTIPLLWELKRRIKGAGSTDQLATMSMAWVMFCQALAPSPVASTEPVAAPPPRRLSPEEIRARAQARRERR